MKKFVFYFILVGLCFISSFSVQAKEVSSEAIEKEKTPSKELVRQAWEASSKSDVERLNKIIEKALGLYGKEAKEQQEILIGFPTRGEESIYQELNDVATCLFIQAEALMNTGKTEPAVKAFQHIIEKYYWAQAWDPRGWHWSISEKSQASINILTGKVVEEEDQEIVHTQPTLHTPAQDDVIDYEVYGKFLNIGKENYHYSIKDSDGLKKAVGEGVYPNLRDFYKNPNYRVAKKSGRLKGSHWDFVNTGDLELAYYKWFTAQESWGVRLFYIGMIFERAQMFHEALRAYHSLVIHFPKTVAWTYWQTPWYPAQAAIGKIKHITRMHPELELEAKDMRIIIKNGSDNDPKNDRFLIWPGKIVPKSEEISKAVHLEKIKRKIGEGEVRLVQYENRHWQLLVKDKPYTIHGMTYAPTKIGQSPDKGTLANWMEEDTNENGLQDGPYDSWVDVNRNNKQDKDEKIVGDFQLMKEMGVNTLRIYHVPETPNKELLRKMYKDYGIRVIMGDFLGKYAIGSGADWSEGTDYENEEHKKNMMDSVKKMVMEHKDEPYMLLWLLGNENNYGVACNADKKPEAYFKFVDEVAQWIKSVDKNHPIAVNNGDTLYLSVFAEFAPNVDIFSANVYRGDYGFGSFWEEVAELTDRPAFISEYGCPAYAKHLTLEEAEIAQADYHKGNWLDMAANFAGNPEGMGNALGGVVFEWLDEWWKNYEPYRHDKKSDAIGPFPGGYYFEEWFGIVSQGKGKHSPFMRQLRKTYEIYQEMWVGDLSNE